MIFMRFAFLRMIYRKMKTLVDIRTPALVLDLAVLRKNIQFAINKASSHGVRLRPHLKTAKSSHVAKLATQSHFGGVTVSTLREAEYLFENGISDCTYAVGICPSKFKDVSTLQQTGALVNVIVDDLGVAHQLCAFAKNESRPFRVFIELDVGYGRSGVLPDSDALIEIASELDSAVNVDLLGVLTHAGHSYDAKDVEGIKRIAEEERSRAVLAAERIRDEGLSCPQVSIGSTPTFIYGESFEGVTEVRPGNYVFFDLSMHRRGVCEISDVAVSVLTTVIVTQEDRGCVLVDAGALALSKDAGSADNPYGYGLIRGLDNAEDFGADTQYIIGTLCQEQGWIAASNSGPVDVSEFVIGHLVRVLPNHSCMTAAAYDTYYVVDGGIEIVAEWDRCHGW